MMTRTPPKALTLVEMIVTLAILSLLTVGSLQVLGNILRRLPMDRPMDQAEWLDAIVGDVLASDLYHAESFEATAAGFALDTLASLEPSTLRQHHLPTRVTYHVEAIGGRSWLVRTQRLRTAGRAESTALVCAGVRSVRLIAMEPTEGAPATGLMPIAETMSVLVEFEPPRASTNYMIRTR